MAVLFGVGALGARTAGSTTPRLPMPKGMEHRFQAKRLREIQARYRNCPVVIDSTGGANRTYSYP